MKKDFVVMQISAMQDDGPSVSVTMVEEKLLRPRRAKEGWDGPPPVRNPGYFGRKRYATAVMDYAEFIDSGLQVGDRVTMELKKSREERLEPGRFSFQSRLE